MILKISNHEHLFNMNLFLNLIYYICVCMFVCDDQQPKIHTNRYDMCYVYTSGSIRSRCV